MKRFELPQSLQFEICSVIGRSVLPSEWGGVESFERFTDSDLQDLRLLRQRNNTLAVAFAMHKLGGSAELALVLSFSEQVLDRGLSLTDWLNGLRQR